MTIELDQVAARIKHALQEDVSSIEIIPNAEQYIVAEVNSEWIFRFVRDPKDPCIVYERAFLPLFAQRSPLPIPTIRYSGPNYIAYRKIEGERLTLENLDQISIKSRREIARQLGDFLTVLHSFPVKTGEELGLSDSWGGWREKAHKVFRCDVAPLLSETTRKGASQLLDQYSGLHNRTVIHGDFAPFNILIDTKAERVAGVLDFGHMTIEENARDFVDIARNFGRIFLLDVISNYTSDNDSDLLARVEVRQKEAILGDAVYSFQTGQTGRLRQRIAEMDKIFSVE
ncbi:MAG: phosphotransferase [Candidatus Latescibacteria bacterium]|nr:phosphotransferase [Candidatus Latescibacterota bacterium]